MRYLLLVMLALGSQCGNANAWGDEGHKIVCEIAFRLAQPDTRAAVRKLSRESWERRDVRAPRNGHCPMGSALDVSLLSLLSCLGPTVA